MSQLTKSIWVLLVAMGILVGLQSLTPHSAQAQNGERPRYFEGGAHKHDTMVIRSEYGKSDQQKKTLNVPCPAAYYPVACHARTTDDCESCKTAITVHECSIRERNRSDDSRAHAQYECFCAAVYQGSGYRGSEWNFQVRAVCQDTHYGRCQYSEDRGYYGEDCPLVN